MVVAAISVGVLWLEKKANLANVFEKIYEALLRINEYRHKRQVVMAGGLFESVDRFPPRHPSGRMRRNKASNMGVCNGLHMAHLRVTKTQWSSFCPMPPGLLNGCIFAERQV